MGLDVIGLQELTILDHELTEECWDSDHYVFKVSDQDSPWHHSAGLPDDGYFCAIAEEKFSFRAGSYGGYGDWRRWLCHLALGITPDDVWSREYSPQLAALPFAHLICFSDCEGVIGPEVSRKLANDFAQYRSFAMETSAKDKDPFNHYLQVYDDFSQVFHMAARGGAVIFC